VEATLTVSDDRIQFDACTVVGRGLGSRMGHHLHAPRQHEVRTRLSW
jgi:hypothetical protein